MNNITEASLRCQKISGRLCIVNSGQVYDVTEFADRHPGGRELIEKHAGEDVTKLMESHELHKHSASAYKIMEKYHTGTYLGAQKLEEDSTRTDIEIFPSMGRTTDALQVYSNGQSNGVENGKTADHNLNGVKFRNGYTNGHIPGMTNGVTSNGVANGHVASSDDIESLIDMSKPIMCQVSTLGDRYMDWVHSPVDTPLHLFTNPFVEFFSKSYWWLVLLYWVPVSGYILYYAFLQFQAKPIPWNVFGLANVELTVSYIPILFCLGFLLWTFDEYIVHRWLFHCKPPADWPSLIWIHFLFHGQHHKSPMDKNRLTFPPVPATVMGFIIFHLYKLIAPAPVALVFFAGTIVGYLCYDLVHYYLHHGNPSLNYFKNLKTYHVKHHFKDHNKGFGISSKLWDYPFGTLIK